MTPPNHHIWNPDKSEPHSDQMFRVNKSVQYGTNCGLSVESGNDHEPGTDNSEPHTDEVHGMDKGGPRGL